MTHSPNSAGMLPEENSGGASTDSPHETPAGSGTTCFRCGGSLIQDRPDLESLDSRCTGCGWFITTHLAELKKTACAHLAGNTRYWAKAAICGDYTSQELDE